jgi:hypothetical protein
MRAVVFTGIAGALTLTAYGLVDYPGLRSGYNAWPSDLSRHRRFWLPPQKAGGSLHVSQDVRGSLHVSPEVARAVTSGPSALQRWIEKRFLELYLLAVAAAK